VDDATGGTHDKENVRCISQDRERESIIENGGFHFKETFMTGDPLDETGELRKILGLRWDSAKKIRSAFMLSLIMTRKRQEPM
jgi:hypothetical protein